MTARLALSFAIVMACSSVSADDSPCGPALARVRRVVDGDTVELDDARDTRIRVLGIDAPELRGPDGAPECGAADATSMLRDLVEEQDVELTYDDATCKDRYGRTLAHVESLDGDAARILTERGWACALHVPPAGEDRREEMQALEDDARSDLRGMWLQCATRLPECAR